MTTVPVELTVTRKPSDGPDSGYEVTTADGRKYEVVKEYYADGPSMFTWVVTGSPGPHCPAQREEWSEHGTKTAALHHISTLPT